MTTCVPSGLVKFGFPASEFIDAMATIPPLRVAIEFAMSGELGSPVDAWMSVSASGSCTAPGCVTDEVGHGAESAVAAAAREGAAPEPVSTGTERSGTILAT